MPKQPEFQLYDDDFIGIKDYLSFCDQHNWLSVYAVMILKQCLSHAAFSV